MTADNNQSRDVSGAASYDQRSQAASVSHVEWEVANGKQSAAFFKALFGWEFKHFSEHYWLCEKAGPVAIGLLEKPTPCVLDACPVFIQVDDMTEQLASAKALGAVLTEAPQQIAGYGAWAKIKEPGGNTIGLFEKSDQ